MHFITLVRFHHRTEAYHQQISVIKILLKRSTIAHQRHPRSSEQHRGSQSYKYLKIRKHINNQMLSCLCQVLSHNFIVLLYLAVFLFLSLSSFCFLFIFKYGHYKIDCIYIMYVNHKLVYVMLSNKSKILQQHLKFRLPIENNHFEILNIRFVRTWLRIYPKRTETQTQHFSIDDTDVLEKSRGDQILNSSQSLFSSILG